MVLKWLGTTVLEETEIKSFEDHNRGGIASGETSVTTVDCEVRGDVGIIII